VSVFLWVVVLALGLVLFGFMMYAFAVGGLGVLEGARFERCPRCGHHGLVVDGRIHAQGCPHRSYRQALRHQWQAWSTGLHLGHH
jgi:hypothetical protein